MRRQLKGCACILVSIVAAAACDDRRAQQADTTRAAASAPLGDTAAAKPTRPATTASPAGTLRRGGPVGQQAAPKPATTPPQDSPSKRVDSTTRTAPPGTSAATPAAAPPVTAPAPKAASPSALSVALARLPFGDKERLEYQVKYGFLGVGSAVLEVLGLDSVRGTPAVHATFAVKGGIRVYRVNDSYESWFDPASYATLRAVQNIDEGSYDRQRDFEFFPDRKMLSENGKPETPTVADPLDEASFLFFLRSIPLEVGVTYEFARYFRPEKNPVRVVVVRKEHVKVPAGEFNAIVVRPVIKTSGIFGEGGRAEVWFTDDSTRTLVQLKSSLKFGSLNLYLRNRRPGTPWEGTATTAGPAR
jgi:hypothetical protein